MYIDRKFTHVFDVDDDDDDGLQGLGAYWLPVLQDDNRLPVLHNASLLLLLYTVPFRFAHSALRSVLAPISFFAHVCL